MDAKTAFELGLRVGMCLPAFEDHPRNPFKESRHDWFLAWNEGFIRGITLRAHQDIEMRLTLKTLLTEIEGETTHEIPKIDKGPEGQAA